MLLSLGLGILSAVFGAAANLSARRILTFTTTRNYIALNFGLMFLLLTPLVPFLFALPPSLPAVGLLLTAALIDAAANYLYFKAFEINDASTASALLALSPFFTLLLLPLFDLVHAAIRPGQVVGVLVIVAGVIVFSRAMPAAESRTAAYNRIARVGFPLLAALLFGANVYLVKILFDQAWSNPFTYYYLRAPFIAAIMLLTLRPRHDWLTRPRLRLAAGRSVLVIAQWLLLLYALQLGNPAVVKAASDASPLFVVLFAGALLNEPANRQQALAAALLVAGLVLLALPV